MGFLADELHSNEREFQSKNTSLLKLMNMQFALQRKTTQILYILGVYAI